MAQNSQLMSLTPRSVIILIKKKMSYLHEITNIILQLLFTGNQTCRINSQ